MQHDVHKRSHVQPSTPNVEELPSHAIVLGVPAAEIFQRGTCNLHLKGEPDVDGQQFLLVEEGRALGVVAFGKQQHIESGRGHKISKGYPCSTVAVFAAPLSTNVPADARGVVADVAVKVPAAKAEPVSKPFAGYETFDDCVADQRAKGKDEESARSICGKLQSEAEKRSTEELMLDARHAEREQPEATAARATVAAASDKGKTKGKKKPWSYSKAEVLEICKAAIRKEDDDVSDPDVELAGEGGIHQHSLNRPDQITEEDGAHQHIFVLPDGTVVATAKDGMHQHGLASPSADVSEAGISAHTHEIIFPDGTTAMTSEDGEHMHALQVSKSAVDGLHQHEYKLEDGTVVQSLTPGQFWEKFGDLEVEARDDEEDDSGDDATKLAASLPLVEARLKSKVSEIYQAIDGLRLWAPALTLLDTEDDSITIQVHGPVSQEVRRSIETELAKRLPASVAARLHLVGDDFGRPAVSSAELAKFVVEFGDRFEVAAAVEDDGPLNAMPEGRQRAAMQYVFDANGGFSTVVRMQADDLLISWALETARGDNLQSTIKTVRDAEAVIESANVDGSRYHRPIRGAYVKALPVLRESLVLLDREGKVQGEEERFVATTVDRPTVEYGLQRDGFHEYFLSDGTILKGVLTCRYDDGWKATVQKHNLPAVLSAEAVEQGIMPPLGRSALPSTLEREIEPEFHYWRADTGKAAQAIRDALVKSQFLNEDNVVLYEGKFRRLHAKVERAVRKDLPDALPAGTPAPKPPAEVDPVQRVASMLPGSGADVVLFDRELSKSMGPDDVAAAAAELHGEDFLIAYPDSPGARLALAKCGRLFKLAGHAGTVFVTSSPFSKASGVEWLPDPAALLADNGSAQAEALLKRMGSEHKVPILKAEERFVYGIVLEPETIDAQNDIYNADEIRKAAHLYMQEFGHIKLMHNGQFIDSKVRILESFVAPVAFQIDGQHVKKGTWLLAVRVLDDGLWEAVKRGDLTGFSIGGTAIKTPAS